jgi:catalase
VITPDRAVQIINGRFGAHPKTRALHAKGVVTRGSFVATPEAVTLTRAPHMQGARVDVTARLSNGNGNPHLPDYAPTEVRGLAVAFELPDGKRTVISAQSAPVFPVPTPDAFMELFQALRPGPSMAWRLPIVMAKHPRVLTSLAANAKAARPPQSFATAPYYAIHAFKWIAADGSERFVRYRWEPQAGEHRISAGAAKQLGRDYLFDELRERLAKQPVRFDLHVQIAEPGDDTTDPSAQWPASRRDVLVGTLELTEIVPEAGLLVFDPTTVIDGIELSDDPVLAFRAQAYSVSIDHRLA